ncbi:SDR family NAD(P)-dependent oxidoreductase [Saccharopolyspora sp. NPDC003752]
MTDSPVPEEETTTRPARRSRRALLGIATAGAAVGAVGTVTGAALPAYLAGPATRPAPAAAPSGRFAGKAVLITGGTSGIGRATALAFAAEGARVSFCGRRTELGRQVEAEIRAAGGEAVYLPADVRIPEQLQHFVDETARRFGGLDIAFNNAGITKTAPLHEMRPEDFDDVHLTNERGVFLSIKYEVPHLLARGGGVIICTSSGSTRPGGTAYTASKRAIEGIVQAASLDYGTRGIRVNAILPGTTDTAFVRPPGIPDAVWPAFRDAWGPLNVSALERMAAPEEIARAVLAMAGDDFGYMTGSSVEVGGGPSRGGKMRMPPGIPS